MKLQNLLVDVYLPMKIAQFGKSTSNDQMQQSIYIFVTGQICLKYAVENILAKIYRSHSLLQVHRFNQGHTMMMHTYTPTKVLTSNSL